jgi:hypothetical protein
LAAVQSGEALWAICFDVSKLTGDPRGLRPLLPATANKVT